MLNENIKSLTIPPKEHFEYLMAQKQFEMHSGSIS